MNQADTSQRFYWLRFSTLFKEETDAVRKVHFAYYLKEASNSTVHVHYQLWLRGELSPTTVRELIWNGNPGHDFYPDDVKTISADHARDMWEKLQQEGFQVLNFNLDHAPAGVKFVVLSGQPSAELNSAGFEPTHIGFSGRGGSLRSPLKPT